MVKEAEMHETDEDGSYGITAVETTKNEPITIPAASIITRHASENSLTYNIWNFNSTAC